MPPGPGEKPTPPAVKGDWMGEYMWDGDWGPARMGMQPGCGSWEGVVERCQEVRVEGGSCQAVSRGADEEEHVRA